MTPEAILATITPSSLDRVRWCPGSAALAARIDLPPAEVKSPAAAEGTMLHRLMEESAADPDPGDPDGPAAEDGLTPRQKRLLEITRALVDRILAAHSGADALVAHELKVDLTAIGLTRNMKADLAIVIPGILVVVVDFKFGWARVASPRYNLQLKAYIVNLCKRYGAPVAIAYIAQPTAPGAQALKSHVFNAEGIAAAEAEISAIIATAVAPDAPTIPGNHCRFCPAKDVCPALQGMVLSLPVHMNIQDHMALLAPDKRAQVYEQLLGAHQWLEHVIPLIQAAMVGQGLRIPGWEIKPGKRYKNWTDEADARQALRELAVDRDVEVGRTVVPESPITPAAAFALFGESEVVRQALGRHIILTPGNPSVGRARAPKTQEPKVMGQPKARPTGL